MCANKTSLFPLTPLSKKTDTDAMLDDIQNSEDMTIASLYDDDLAEHAADSKAPGTSTISMNLCFSNVSGTTLECVVCGTAVEVVERRSMGQHYHRQHRELLLEYNNLSSYFHAQAGPKKKNKAKCKFCPYKENDQMQQAFHLFAYHREQLPRDKKTQVTKLSDKLKLDEILDDTMETLELDTSSRESAKKRFQWNKMIKSCLSASEKQELTPQKLQKSLLNLYIKLTGEECSKGEFSDKLHTVLSKSSKFSLVDGVVKLS